jgi:hypothetical protein
MRVNCCFPGRRRIGIIVLVFLMLLSVFAVLPTQGRFADLQTVVRLESEELKVGQTASLHLILESAPFGMRRMSVVLTMRDSTVAEFRDIRAHALLDRIRVLTLTKSTVELEVEDLYNVAAMGAKNLHLLGIIVAGLRGGQSEVSLRVTSFVTDDRGSREIPKVQPGMITVLDPAQPAPPSTTPTPPGHGHSEAQAALVVESKVIPVGKTETLHLMLKGAPGGLQRLQMRLTLSNARSVQITEASSPTIDSRFFEIINRTATLLEFRLADFRNQIVPGATNILILALQIKGLAPGVATLTPTVQVFVDDAGKDVSVVGQAGQIQVQSTSLAPLPGAKGPAQDLDGDGLFEDVNGDGKLTYEDASLFAFELPNPIIQQHKNFFDFNHDGKIDFNDAIALAAMVPPQ